VVLPPKCALCTIAVVAQLLSNGTGAGGTDHSYSARHLNRCKVNREPKAELSGPTRGQNE
jgi:hypothetical protein